jgi:tRNA threonylcarbamoyladenosine biosynthesis protein TsaB
MRYTLGIDTAAPDGSVALARDGRALAFERLLPREHSSGLSLAVERLLAARGIALADLTGIAVSEGPGSFTGLRIGLAWAKGVSLAREIPLALVPSHEAAAHAERAPSRWIATVLPSERGFVEVALWEGLAAEPAWGPAKVETEDAVTAVMDEVRHHLGNAGEERAAAALELRPATAAIGAALAEDAFDLGVAIRGPEPLAGPIAEIGDRLLAEGRRADLVTAAPAYGREPNARKPEP